MSRLDELIALRRQLDVEIERERAAAARSRNLRLAVLSVTTRGTWNQRVLAATCHHYAIDLEQVTSGRRDRVSTDARHVAMWLIRDSGRSYPEIGTELGMDHTSVINGVRRVNGNDALLSTAHVIREQLTGKKAA